MVLLSFFPATLIRYFGVWEEAQNLAGQMFPAWFQTRLIDAEFGKNVANLSNIRRKGESPIQVPDASQLFISAHYETLAVVSMRICNPDRSPFGIDG